MLAFVENCFSAPAITRSGSRFLNLACFFQSKFHVSATDHQQITSTKGISQHCGKEPRAKLPRWLRAIGRFGGSKNRVREELSIRDKHLDEENTTDGYSLVMHLQVEKCHHLALKKAGEEQDQSSCEQRKRGRRVVTRFELPQEPRKEAPRKGRSINKWAICEDVPRIARQDEQRDARSHYELVKPVLEPMPVFSTSNLENGKELGYLHGRASSEGDHPKRLLLSPQRLDSDDDFAEQVRAIRECKKGTGQGMAVPTEATVTMATLGDISSLVAMLDPSSSTFCKHSALVALLNLATGNDLNKVAIVDAGAVPKMVALLNPNSDPSTQQALLACFATLSTLDRNQTLIAAAGAIPPLTNLLNNDTCNIEIQSNALELLHNLSLTQSNLKTLVHTGATTQTLNLMKNPRHSEKALAVLANLVTGPLGRRATMDTDDGVEALLAILTWGANPKWQETAVGVLMVIAEHSYGHRQTMVRKRAVPALLELSLLGTAVAQKRAMRVLEFLRDDREQARVGHIPKPNHHDLVIPTETAHNMVGDGREAVNVMVNQSLEHNFQHIVRRGFVKSERIMQSHASQP